jgi:hypothetical protein
MVPGVKFTPTVTLLPGAADPPVSDRAGVCAIAPPVSRANAPVKPMVVDANLCIALFSIPNTRAHTARAKPMGLRFYEYHLLRMNYYPLERCIWLAVSDLRMEGKTALAGMEHRPQQDYTLGANLVAGLDGTGV